MVSGVVVVAGVVLLFVLVVSVAEPRYCSYWGCSVAPQNTVTETELQS